MAEVFCKDLYLCPRSNADQRQPWLFGVVAKGRKDEFALPLPTYDQVFVAEIGRVQYPISPLTAVISHSQERHIQFLP
jgi:hypothetical protein